MSIFRDGYGNEVEVYEDNAGYLHTNRYTSSGGGSSVGDGESIAFLILIGILLFLPILLEEIFGIHISSTLNTYGYILSFIWSAICWVVWSIFHPHTIIYYLIFSKIFWFVLGSIAISFWFGTTTYLIAKLFCK